MRRPWPASVSRAWGRPQQVALGVSRRVTPMNADRMPIVTRFLAGCGGFATSKVPSAETWTSAFASGGSLLGRQSATSEHARSRRAPQSRTAAWREQGAQPTLGRVRPAPEGCKALRDVPFHHVTNRASGLKPVRRAACGSGCATARCQAGVALDSRFATRCYALMRRMAPRRGAIGGNQRTPPDLVSCGPHRPHI